MKVKSALHNGFTEDLPNDKKIEIEKGVIWAELFGYAGWIVEDGNIQAIPPRVQGVGFVISKLTKKGEIETIKMKYGNDMSNINDDITIDTSFFYLEGIGNVNGFYPMRSIRGLPGPRGISTLLPIALPIRKQTEIHADYSKYAEHQGLAHPVVKVKNLTPSKKSEIQGDLQAPRKDLAVIIDMEDEFNYKSPQQNAYDPTGMMEYADKFVARHTSLNMFQLTGNPMGAILSASETNQAEWFGSVKSYQDHLLPNILPILMALGLTKNVKFSDPDEPTFLSKMQGVKLIKETFEGLIESQQMLDLISDHMGYEEDKRLKLKEGYGEETNNYINGKNNINNKEENNNGSEPNRKNK